MEKAIDLVRKNKTKRRKDKGNLFNRSGRWFSYIVVTLPLIVWAVVYFGSHYYTFELAFVSTSITGEKSFTLSYFQKMFQDFAMNGSLLSVAFGNTMKYWIAGVFMSFVSLFVAYVFYKKILFGNIYAVIIYLPGIISGVVYISVFKNLFVTYGPLWSLFYDVFGVEIGYPFTDPELATPTILLYQIWTSFGGSIFVYIGVMNRIPKEVLESGKLDGCSEFREFRSIIFPILWSTYTAYMFPLITGIFMSTGPILYFTGTNEYFNTYTLNFYIYVSTLNGDFHMGAAMGLFLTVITVPIVVLARWLMKKVDWEVEF